MEGPVATALAKRDITFQGEPHGSKEIANLIIAGLRKPDVVILVDPSVESRLAHAGFVAQSWKLGTTSLGLGWERGSRFSPSCHGERSTSAGSASAKSNHRHDRRCVIQALQTPGLRIARTDPRLDPKGAYTIEAMRMLVGPAAERKILGLDENPSQTFPEESLLAHLEAGDSDVGFVYETEAIARHLQFIPLPGRASLTDKIVYTIAIVKNGPHPSSARAFVNFLLHGKGRAILSDAGINEK
jgi:molybdate/tungstate transport system substrate-binding protein